MPSTNVGVSLSDFLLDLVGGDSNVKMAGLAAGEGVDPASKEILAQLHQKIKDIDSRNYLDIDGEAPAKLSDAATLLRRRQEQTKLLNSLQTFYSKRYGSPLR
jgi:hypothetical protein